jgi:hypothetical protein
MGDFATKPPISQKELEVWKNPVQVVKKIIGKFSGYFTKKIMNHQIFF